MKDAHPYKCVSEPPSDGWTRHRFSEVSKTKADKDYELKAERETDRDLSKPIEQLLCDVHDQAEHAIDATEENDPVRLQINAIKRMVAMMAQVSISNKKSTRWSFIVSIVAVTIALASFIVSISK